MGITKENQVFDLTGTSEHAGVIVNSMDSKTDLVCSSYLDKFVHYGVTASSGASLNFNKINFGENDVDIQSCITKNPPIFLPYLNGERAPVWDSDASGVFFGLTGKTDKKLLSYSVLEGVAFSIFSILELIPSFKPGIVTVGGGAANNEVLNKLKAEIFSSDILLLEQNQSSALGAYMISAVGMCIYTGFDDAIKDNCISKKIIKHDGKFNDLFLKRYEIYKSMYPSLKDMFGKFRGIK
jgi:xylulokinase